MPQMSPMNWMYLTSLTYGLMKMNILLTPHQSLNKNSTHKKIISSKKWMW